MASTAIPYAKQQALTSLADELASVSSTNSKRSWLNTLGDKISLLVTRPRRSLDTARSQRSPSPVSPIAQIAAEDPLRAVVTANWVARSHAPTPATNAWRSEVTLHPSSHYHIVTPPAMHSLPSGPTALAPSPYMSGSTALRRPRAHTTVYRVPSSSSYVAVPVALPSPRCFGNNVDHGMCVPRVLPPRPPTPTELPPVPTQFSRNVQDSHRAAAHCRTRSQTYSAACTHEAPQHVYARGSDGASASTSSLTVAEALNESFPQLSDAPSSWGASSLYHSKRTSSSSTHTFGA